MAEINKDVVAINEALDDFGSLSESVGYANGSIAELVSEKDNATNPDDKEAYSSAIERMFATLDSIKDERAQARENVKRAFEHYYS